MNPFSFELASELRIVWKMWSSIGLFWISASSFSELAIVPAFSFTLLQSFFFFTVFMPIQHPSHAAPLPLHFPLRGFRIKLSFEVLRVYWIDSWFYFQRQLILLPTHLIKVSSFFFRRSHDQWILEADWVPSFVHIPFSLSSSSLQYRQRALSLHHRKAFLLRHHFPLCQISSNDLETCWLLQKRVTCCEESFQKVSDHCLTRVGSLMELLCCIFSCLTSLFMWFEAEEARWGTMLAFRTYPSSQWQSSSPFLWAFSFFSCLIFFGALLPHLFFCLPKFAMKWCWRMKFQMVLFSLPLHESTWIKEFIS